MTTVRSRPRDVSASCTDCSVAVSSALVASSRSTMGASCQGSTRRGGLVRLDVGGQSFQAGQRRTCQESTRRGGLVHLDVGGQRFQAGQRRTLSRQGE